jgi:Uma2 family endonuclease
MSRLQFFAWAEAQEGRYEFDGFQPVAMTDGNMGHSLVTGNVLREVGVRLAGKACRVVGPDAGVATVGETVRYPDAVVTCSKFSQLDRLVPNPVIVFEVVSPTSIRIDRVTKVREYNAVPSIQRYIIVEPNAKAITVFWRDQESKLLKAEPPADNEILPLPEVGFEIPIEGIYEGIVFDDALMDDAGK